MAIPPSRFSLDLWIQLTLLVAILAVYGQTVRHDFLNYDDPEYVTEPHVRAGLKLSSIAWAFKSGYTSNSFPLTWISHMFDFHFFGAQSGPPHLMNVAIHAISTLLLFALLKRLTGATGPSAFVAFTFALHPLHVESVAWVAERKDVLCAFFWMLTLWAYALYADRPSTRRYAIVVLMFCCGLMSKPMIVTLPGILLLMDVWPLQRFAKKSLWQLVLEKLPLLGLSVCASVVTYITQEHQGTVIAASRIPVTFRIGNAFLSYVVYLRDFVWPAKLAVFYPYIDRPAWQMIAAALLVIAATAVAIRSIRSRPYVTAGWFWYLGTLLPVIGLIQVGSQSRADRYTYIPLIGISMIVAWGTDELFTRRRWNRRLGLIAAGGVCLGWAAITWVNVQYWRNSVTLFAHALEVTDANYVAYNNLGGALRQQGRIREAIADFEHAVAIRSDDPLTRDSLGEALTADGKIEDALLHLREAVRLDPGYAKARVDLGAALTERSSRRG